MQNFYSWQITKYAESKLYEKCIIMYFSSFHFFATAAPPTLAQFWRQSSNIKQSYFLNKKKKRNLVYSCSPIRMTLVLYYRQVFGNFQFDCIHLKARQSHWQFCFMCQKKTEYLQLSFFEFDCLFACAYVCVQNIFYIELDKVCMI